ncbi:MAG: restriction endonuclease subunit S [Candidatus Dormiibacterota bacterium]
MKLWHRARLDWLVVEERRTVDPTQLSGDSVFHYSIPSLDQVGDGQLEATEDIGSAKLLLRGGEVLVSKLNPRLPRVLLAEAHDVPTVASTEFISLRPGPEVDDRFLRYWLTSEPLRQVLNGATMSVTRSQQRIRPEVLTKMWVEFPPRALQRSIADYLDAETARVDVLIGKRQRMVELLTEREVALIHELTARGVRPAVVVDSGVRWLGAVPQHWGVMQIRRIGDVRRGASPRPIDDPKYFDEEGDYSWVRIADVTASGRYLTETSQRLSVLGSSLSVKLAPGALFVSIAGSVGKPMIAKIKCCIHDGFVYFEHLRIRPDYLYYLFRASQLFQGLGKLGTQLNLNTDTIGTIVIAVPPLYEQDEIVASLNHHVDVGSRLRSAIGREIDLLQQRRESLVAAAVTGALDIPGKAA